MINSNTFLPCNRRVTALSKSTDPNTISFSFGISNQSINNQNHRHEKSISFTLRKLAAMNGFLTPFDVMNASSEGRLRKCISLQEANEAYANDIVLRFSKSNEDHRENPTLTSKRLKVWKSWITKDKISITDVTKSQCIKRNLRHDTIPIIERNIYNQYTN